MELSRNKFKASNRNDLQVSSHLGISKVRGILAASIQFQCTFGRMPFKCVETMPLEAQSASYTIWRSSRGSEMDVRRAVELSDTG